jgi:hypothetical protein
LLKWQKWGLAALVFIVFIQMVMSNEYKLEALWYFKWNVYEVGGHIIAEAATEPVEGHRPPPSKHSGV